MNRIEQVTVSAATECGHRVAHLVWNLIRGGTEGQCARVAMGLRADGGIHRVAVFRREGFFLPAVESVCGPVYHLNIQRLISGETRRQVRQFAEWLSTEQIGLLHAWDADAAIFGSKAARIAGIPLVTSRRDLGEIYPFHKMWLMNAADRQALAIVCNSPAISDRLAARGLSRSKIRTIGNVVDVAEFDRLAAEPSGLNLPDAPLVGMVSRLDPEKDLPSFLRAAVIVSSRSPAARFVIAGDGVERAALEQLAKELGVFDRVVFLGDVAAVPSLLRRLSVGVLTSKSNEGLSNTLLEYMAAGIPFVATDCGGNRDLAGKGQSGAIVSIGDVQGLAREICSLLDDPSRRAAMGRAGRLHVEQHHTPGIICQEFGRLYDELLTRPA